MVGFARTFSFEGAASSFSAPGQRQRERWGSNFTMRVIRRNRLTWSEAEDVLATVWQALEEHKIPSPRLRAYPVAGGVDLTLEFSSEDDAERIKQLLRA
jgi:hypothetical protein